jgi:hypothetical protein
MTRFFLCLLISTVFSSAQDAPVIKTKILTYALGGLPDEFTGYFKNEDQIMMFRASDGTLGVPIRYQGQRRFILRDSEDAFNSAPGGRELPPPLGFVDLPENASNVLILAAPLEGRKVKLLAYDISPGSLGKGEYRIFNFSHSMLSMLFGTQKVVLPAGRDVLVRDESWKQKIMTFPIRIATVSENKAKPVYSNFWEHHPSSRTLLFMFNGNRPNQAIRFMDFSVDGFADDPAGL